jgi:hypothetical protein
MAVADRDAREWRLVKCLNRISFLLGNGDGYERVAILARILVPLEREDDALILLNFADYTAEPR